MGQRELLTSKEAELILKIDLTFRKQPRPHRFLRRLTPVAETLAEHTTHRAFFVNPPNRFPDQIRH